MPYRQIFLGGETFVVRVPAGAITEWLEARDRNKHIGYPDRPPDVDTPLVRGWIQHPNETNSFNFLASSTTPHETFIVYTISCPALNGAVDAKFLIDYHVEEKEYKLRLVVRTEEGYAISDKEIMVPEENIEAAFNSKLELFAETFIDRDTIPFISTFVDYEELMEETSLAEKELGEYYSTDKRLVN